MGRYASDKGGFEAAPAGNHLGICVRIIDLGTQQSEFGIAEKIMLMWETPNELMTDGRPYVISAILRNSLNPKAKLRQWLEAWRSRAFSPQELQRFDLQKILGKPCMVSVVDQVDRSGNTRRVVNGISAVPKGMQVPKAHNEPWAFWIEEWDQARFESLSEKVRGWIQASAEYADRAHKRAGGNGQQQPEDDIPWTDDGAPADHDEQPAF